MATDGQAKVQKAAAEAVTTEGGTKEAQADGIVEAAKATNVDESDSRTGRALSLGAATLSEMTPEELEKYLTEKYRKKKKTR